MKRFEEPVINLEMIEIADVITTSNSGTVAGGDVGGAGNTDW